MGLGLRDLVLREQTLSGKRAPLHLREFHGFCLEIGITRHEARHATIAFSLALEIPNSEIDEACVKPRCLTHPGLRPNL